MNERLAKLRQISDAILTALVILLLAILFCIPAFSRQPASAETLGTISLQLKSSRPDITTGNRSYSLDAASYAIYSNYECTQLEGQITTDESGHGVSAQLPAGRYYLRQSASSNGYVLSDELLQADIEIDCDASIEHEVTPDYANGDLILFESNAETGTTAPSAAAKFADASFTLSYYDSTAGNAALGGATRSWTFKTDSAGEIHLNSDYLVNGSPLYKDASDASILPIGHYVFTSNEFPAGFTLASQELAFDVIESNESTTDPAARFEPVEAKMQVIRGDFAFKKVDENRNPLPNIPFLLSYSNGESGDSVESHVIVTDANGDFSSDAARIAHTSACNANDAAVTRNPDGSYSVDESKLNSSCGIWFSMDRSGTTSTPNNVRGALPYGTYQLQELPCTENTDKNLVTTQFTVYKDGYTTTLDNIVNTTPAINSLISDGLDKDKLLRPQDNAIIHEELTYHNLVPGTAYTLNASLMCKDTGEPLVDEQGSPVVIELEFTPQEKDGALETELEINASDYAGCELILLDELRSSAGMVITSAPENSMDQTIEVEPFITCRAFDSSDDDTYIMGSEAHIAERIDYTGLKAGSKYRVHASLIDKATGNAARDKQGNPIVSDEQFVPDKTKGTISVDLPVDATAYEGHDLVVFNQVDIDGGKTIANLHDIEDKTQTVKTVKLSTNAYDEEDGDKIFNGSANNVCLVDTVKYANLEPGVQYKLSGVLMNKETGTALLIDNKEVNTQAQFVPDEISGSVDVKFEFDASEQTSDVLVAFETLSCDDKVVAKHTDLDDVAQTVTSEDIDPDLELAMPDAANTEGGTGISEGGFMPKTGDTFTRGICIVLVLFASICICTAYALHRRSRMIKAIRCDETGEVIED